MGGREESEQPPSNSTVRPQIAGRPWTLGHACESKAGRGVGGGDKLWHCPDWEPAWSLVLRFVRFSPSQRPGDPCGGPLLLLPYVCIRLRLGRIFTWVWDGAQLLSRVRLFTAPWMLAHQAPLSMGFSMQEYWSGLPFPPPGELPDPGIELASLVSPRLPHWQGDSLSLAPPRRCVGWRRHVPRVAGAQRPVFLP